jgi:thiol-disulfide isomerase/thioredoxin
VTRLPGFADASGWLNSEPIAQDDLEGKVVAVQFWTYTCINWLRTFPYFRAWADAYAGTGLVAVGVHTPEFGVEHELENVRRAVGDLGVTYPVAIDNDYAVWEAFSNQYWPALYVSDGTGKIRYEHFGEGAYEKSEQAIRELLEGELPEPVDVEPTGIELAADSDDLGSPESYIGFARSQGFASPGGAVPRESHVYELPSSLGLNQWALAGDWTVDREEAVSNQVGGRITFRFHARDLNLILVPPAEGSARFRVRLDGEPPGAMHGLDVDEKGNGIVEEPRLYQLIRQNGRIADRDFELELLDPGAGALCFTFG